MAAFLALISAAAYGAGDFLGGLASRRLPTAAVTLRTGAIGLAGLLVALPLVGGRYVASDVPLAVAGGLAGAVGIYLLYRGLAVGTMSVVAPITALLATVVPVVVGLASGERPAAIALVGIPLALTAIGLLAWEPTPPGAVRETSAATVAAALLAGLGFGSFFVALDATSDGAGLYPIVVARAAAVVLFVVIAVLAREPVPPGATRQGRMPWILAGSGLLDAGANATLLTATQHGLLTLVAVLGSLYPASTLLLARIVLGERLTRPQLIGVGLAGVAVVLVALG